MNSVAGQLLDTFTFEEIESWVKILRQLPALKILDNDCHGVNEKNPYN